MYIIKNGTLLLSNAVDISCVNGNKLDLHVTIYVQSQPKYEDYNDGYSPYLDDDGM
jgi:hypothetical protein